MSADRFTTYRIVKNNVNRNGELHLDKAHTHALLDMLQIDQTMLKAAKQCIADVQAELEALSGGDQSNGST